MALVENKEDPVVISNYKAQLALEETELDRAEALYDKYCDPKTGMVPKHTYKEYTTERRKRMKERCHQIWQSYFQDFPLEKEDAEDAERIKRMADFKGRMDDMGWL